MNNKEQMMNEVLAEWVGFKERSTPGHQSTWWEFNGYPYDKCPDFMNSETDCFRWIIPWLREKGYGLDITVGRCGVFANLWSLDERGSSDTESQVAFGIDTSVCAAICSAVFTLQRAELAGGVSGH